MIRFLTSSGQACATEAKETLLVSLYRQGKLSHVALAGALGLDRCETEDVLRKHDVTEDLSVVEDYLLEVPLSRNFGLDPSDLVVADASPRMRRRPKIAANFVELALRAG